jgi:transposase
MLIVGLDWSRRNHAYLFMDSQGQILERATVTHSGAGLTELASHIRQYEPQPEQVRIGVETHDGALLDWLVQQGYAVFPIQPKSAQRARDMFRPSGSKDDRVDALVVAEYVRLNTSRMQPLKPDSPRTAQLRELLRWRADLVQQRTAEISRVRALLDEWSPGLSRLCDDLTRQWQQQLLSRFPIEADLVSAHGNTIRAFARRYRLRQPSLERIEGVRRANPMAVPEPRGKMIRRQVVFLIQQIRRLTEQIDELERDLAELIDQHPDAAIFQSLPVGGSVSIAALMALFGENRERPGSWETVAAHCGVAPITIASGKSKSVRKRRACDKTYQHAVLHFAFNSAFIQGCWAKDYYRRKRAEGTRHHAALRCLAKQWIKIIYRLWQDRVTYDETFRQNQQHARAA